MDGLIFYDCNCVFGRKKQAFAYDDLNKDKLIGQLKKVNVERAVVSHTAQQFLSVKRGNEILLSKIKNDDIFIPAAAVMPNAAGEFMEISEFDTFVQTNGIKMIKMYPKTQNFSASEWQMGELYSYFEKKRLPLMVSIEEVGADGLYGMLSNHPALRVICTDCGFSNDRDMMRLMEIFQNLYLETGTFYTHGGIEYVVEKFGAQRLLFGTNLQHAEPGAAAARILYADITESEKRKIAYENMKTMLGQVGGECK